MASLCAVTQLQQEEDQGVVVCTSSSGLTLRRLSVWMCDPLVRLKTLAALVDVCAGNCSLFLSVTVGNWCNRFLLSVVCNRSTAHGSFSAMLRSVDGSLDNAWLCCFSRLFWGFWSAYFNGL